MTHGENEPPRFDVQLEQLQDSVKQLKETVERLEKLTAPPTSCSVCGLSWIPSCGVSCSLCMPCCGMGSSCNLCMPCCGMGSCSACGRR